MLSGIDEKGLSNMRLDNGKAALSVKQLNEHKCLFNRLTEKVVLPLSR